MYTRAPAVPTARMSLIGWRGHEWKIIGLVTANAHRRTLNAKHACTHTRTHADTDTLRQIEGEERVKRNGMTGKMWRGVRSKSEKERVRESL